MSRGLSATAELLVVLLGVNCTEVTVVAALIKCVILMSLLSV